MKRTVRLQPDGAGPPLPVELETGPDGAFTVTVEQETLAGHAEAVPGGGLLRVGDRTIPYLTARVGGELHVWLDGHVYRFALASGASAVAAPAGRAPGIAGGEITAPMPGRVVQVLATPGAAVADGTLLVVVESMKVQFNLPAPAAGTVREVRCAVGQIVELGDLLVRLELAS